VTASSISRVSTAGLRPTNSAATSPFTFEVMKTFAPKSSMMYSAYEAVSRELIAE
jgi:hypothetical protein